MMKKSNNSDERKLYWIASSNETHEEMEWCKDD